jgi:hypothetical protein
MTFAGFAEKATKSRAALEHFQPEWKRNAVLKML